MKYCFECYEREQMLHSVLCAVCSMDSEILQDYLDDEESPCKEPTNFEPGTEEKINILSKRFSAKQSLHHRNDNVGKPKLSTSKNLGGIISVTQLQSNNPLFTLNVKFGNSRRTVSYENFYMASKESKKKMVRDESSANKKISLFKNNQSFWKQYLDELKGRKRAIAKMKSFK